MQEHAHVVILLGPPGAGKGTQSARLSAALGIPAISTGEILRSECQSGSDLGREVEAVLARGELVDDRIMNELVSRRLRESDCARGCILDGYPRTIAQARHLDTSEFRSAAHFRFYCFGARCHCPPRRPSILPGMWTDIQHGRRSAAAMARLSSTRRRKPAVIRERLRVYRRNMDKLVRFYQSRDYHPIHATRAPDMVFQELLRLLDPPACAKFDSDALRRIRLDLDFVGGVCVSSSKNRPNIRSTNSTICLSKDSTRSTRPV